MLWPKLLSWMKKLLMSKSFWLMFLFTVVLLVGHFAWPWLSPPPPARLQKARPAVPAALLSGPAAFTLLALVIAFGVYLRQVSNGAMDALTKIDAGKEEIYPPKKRHTELKINSLRSTNAKLDIVAPFMVLLAIVIVLRIMFDAVVRFPNPPEWALGVLLPLVDLVITIWVCLLFAVIGLVHYLLQRDDAIVRGKTEEYLRAIREADSANQRASAQPGLGHSSRHTTEIFVPGGDTMNEQNFSNHGKFVPMFHFFVIPVLIANLIWNIVSASRILRHSAAISASLLAVVAFSILVSIALLLLAFLARLFALGVQDRVIRLEERMRYERLLPHDLSPRIGEFTINQLVSLRFASDAELPALARKVLDGKMNERRAIKQMVQNWRADYQRI